MLDDIVTTQGVATIGLYWPIKREINLMPWASTHEGQGKSSLCLPVLVTPKTPPEYRRWIPGDNVVLPGLVLASAVGFDQAGHWLGEGGGNFDRTFGSLSLRPVVIGIDHDFSALTTSFLQPHDVPIDAVLTTHRDMLPSNWRTHAF
jgi:5-formyltetrahydrofolate cyclo-ligase